MEIIGKKLQEQYEYMSIKTRYKQYLDPSIEETKKFCMSLRRNAKEERILFHYNGHGVPAPTSAGEFWLFNKEYTKYIPVSMFDLQTWLGGSTLYIYDVSKAGNLLDNFERFIDKHNAENAEIKERDANAVLPHYSNNIQLAACGATERLPTNPELPGDLFTSCLTTPIDISLRCHVLGNPLPSSLRLKDLMRIPGRSTERRSPMGELNWILTAVTDTIAWNVLPSGLFKELFRQDLMVAALFRNFLVAQRIMRTYGCHPQSTPAIPALHEHPLWEAWDLAVEMVLSQLPALLAAEDSGTSYEYQSSTFFSEQLTAFQNYLERDSLVNKKPTQLPIVLQVLLSQTHRMRALILLSKFLDLGPWAVNMALDIGIFPYVVKLLQSPARELQPVMVFIWARIVAIDPRAVQGDLLRENGFQYFINVLRPDSGPPILKSDDSSEHKAMSAFIIAQFCKEFPQGQRVCLQNNLLGYCVENLTNSDHSLLRQWSCLCISMLWENFDEAKWAGIRIEAHLCLIKQINDPMQETRVAAIHALTKFLGIRDKTEHVEKIEEAIACEVIEAAHDGSSLVRAEFVVFCSVFVKRYKVRAMIAAFETIRADEHEMIATAGPTPEDFEDGASKVPDIDPFANSRNTIQGVMWHHLLKLSVDGHPEIAQAAGVVIDWVYEAMLRSPFKKEFVSMLENMLTLEKQQLARTRPSSLAPSTARSLNEAASTGSSSSKGESYLSTGLRRNASVAAALKFLGLGTSESSGISPPKNDLSNQFVQQPVQQKRAHGPQRPGEPAEWSTPPNFNEHTSVVPKYRLATVPVSKDFGKNKPRQNIELPLTNLHYEWCVEVLSHPRVPPEI